MGANAIVETSGAIALIQNAEPAMKPLSRLRPGKYTNPRSMFNGSEMEELIQSVKDHGILQSLLVRPIADEPGFFEVVAGNRRRYAVFAVHGADYEVPVLIKAMTDDEAALAALIENVQREGMSETDEAKAAADELGRTNGNRKEAARRIGWSVGKLEKRLALMNCSAAVQAALTRKDIKLGHAELLAALPKTTQDIFLPAVIKHDVPMIDLKRQIEGASSKLETAIFDKADCLTCAHNSTIQASMFAESITEGGCTYTGCFAEKTEAALKAIEAGLKDEYPVIRIIRVGENETVTKLLPTGPKGVGIEQAAACRGCKDFGAAVSGLPQSTGSVFKDICFNPGCNAHKVAANIKAEKRAATEAASSVKAGNAVSVSAKGDKPKADDKPTTSVAPSERMKAYRLKLWRQAMKKEISAVPSVSIQYLIALCLSGYARNINSTTLTEAFDTFTGGKTTSDLKKNLKATQVATVETLVHMNTWLAASAMEDLDESNLKQLAKHHGLDLTKHWTLDAEFLDLMTKSEIDYVATEVGLAKAYGDGFKKLFSEKKGDLIEKLLTVNTFNYSAIIPAVINY